ncbi:MAG: hypothetical protein R3A44_05215 [Caldilineaceae bacterium]
MTILTAKAATEDRKADWLLVFEAALRVGNFASLDKLLLCALSDAS